MWEFCSLLMQLLQDVAFSLLRLYLPDGLLNKKTVFVSLLIPDSVGLMCLYKTL